MLEGCQGGEVWLGCKVVDCEVKSCVGAELLRAGGVMELVAGEVDSFTMVTISFVLLVLLLILSVKAERLVGLRC